MIHLVLFESFVTNLLLFEHHQKNCSLADSFLDPMAELNTAVVEGRMSETSAWNSKHWFTTSFLQWLGGTDSALFSGLRKLEVARPSDSNVRALLSVRLSFGEYPLVGI